MKDNLITNRILYLDYAKGIAIILMLFGHAYASEGIIKTWIFAFHMPVFFLICGYLVHLKNPNGISFSSVTNYLKNRYDNLLKPYLFFGAILTSYFCLLSFLSEREWNIMALRKFITFQGVESMWFLPVYFYAELLFLLCLRYLKLRVLSILIIVIFTLFCCCESTFTVGYFKQIRLVLAGLVFIYAGYMYAKLKLCKRLGYILMIFLLITFSVGSQVNGFASMFDMGSSMLYFINALGLSLVLLTFCRYLEQHSFHFQKLLLYFGVNSIIVLCTNNLLIEVIRLLDYKTLGIFSSNFIPSFFFFLIIFTLEIPIIKIFEGKFKHKQISSNVSKKNE